MTGRELDDLFKSPPPATDPALLENIAKSMGATMAPVTPLLPSWLLTAVLVTVSAIISTLGAALLGFQGIRRLSGEKIGLIFSLLLLFTILAATVSVAGMIPGSYRLVGPRALLVASILAFAAVFAALFHDDSMSGFVPRGLKCLAAGVLIAIPAGLASWLVLRRGLAVDPVSAGLAGGTMAGLAGLITLELHCPNFATMHLLVWHTAVILVSATLGALVARASRSVS